MKNFKIYAVSGEDNSKYEISLNELVTKGNYSDEEVCKNSIHAMDGDGIQHYLVDLR